MEEQDYATTYRLEDRNWWFAGMRDLCLDQVRRAGRAGPDRRILDVGCGTGRNLEALEPLAPATGLDLSGTALAFCRSRGCPRLLQGRGEVLPLPDASVDVVTAIGVVEHIEADADAVREWRRVLAPDGQLVLLTSAYRFLWSGHDVSNHHVRRYRAGEVRALLEDAGLVDVRVTYANTALFPGIALVRLLQRFRRRGAEPPPHKDTGEVPGWLNRALTVLLSWETALVRRWDLPFGVSILAEGRSPSAPA